jgi:hypothetical protein
MPKILLAAVGDLMFPARAEIATEDCARIRQDFFSDADLVFANLEVPFTADRVGAAVGAIEEFAGKPERAPLLKELGVGIVNIGTNHCMDWGSEGINTTRRLLEGLGIAYVGAGRNRQEAERPTILNIKGVKVGVAGFCKPGAFSAGGRRPGAAVIKHNKVRAAIRAIREDVDVLVLSLHAGIEFSQYPTVAFRDQCRIYAEEGADVVLCHHAHVLQGIDRWGDSVIAYNLGNFMFDNISGLVSCDAMFEERHLSIVLRLHIDAEKGRSDYTFIPVRIDTDGLPQPPQGEDRLRVCNLVDRLSGELPSLDDSRVYVHAVGNLMEREIAVYREIWRRKGVFTALWTFLRNIRWRHIKMVFIYLVGKWRKGRKSGAKLP